MAIQIQKIFCPQCGANRCSPVAGTPNLYACQSCGTEFVISDSNARKNVNVVHSADSAQWDRVKKLKWLFLAVLAMLAIALVLPSLLHTKKPTPAVQERERGRLEVSTVVDNGGKISVVKLFQDRSSEKANYRVEVTDMQSGKRLSEPQRFSFARAEHFDEGEFKQFSDSNLYLMLQNRQFMRFDTGAQQFVDLTTQLPERFAAELSVGISDMKFAYHEYPDALEVTTRDGKKYYVFWLIGKIAPKEGFGAIYKKAVANYQQSSKFYRFAPVESRILDKPYLLIQYWKKTQPGQMLQLGYFDLAPADNDQVQNKHLNYINVGSGYFVKPYVVTDGLIKIEALESSTIRFKAEIVAQNDKRLLLAYYSTPMGEDGRVLQLMDKSDNRVIWSRTADQLPQLSKSDRGAYTRASAVASGFYFTRGAAEPAFFMDNDGSLVHDFTTDDARKP